MLGRNKSPVAPRVAERVRAHYSARGRVNPIRSVATGGKVQHQLFDIVPGRHRVGTRSGAGTVVKVEGILPAGLADAPAERSRRHASDNELLILVHLEPRIIKAAVGFAKGSFGNGQFGFDADTIEWISPPLLAGVYKFAVKITDQKGGESISETGQVTVTPPAKPAKHLNIASFNKQTGQMMLEIT